jgi:hypothetical protein
MTDTGYKIIKTDKLPNTGILRQTVNFHGREQWFDYYSIRAALVWPTAESPAYYLVGGEETWDERFYNPASGRGVVRIVKEFEYDDLALDQLFDRLTDDVTLNLADTIYIDLKHDDYRGAFYDYLDRTRLRNIHTQGAPYEDFTMRVGIVKDYDQTGELSIDKGSPLYGELQGISRADLVDAPELRFYRLNALSYLLSGFKKYAPIRRSPLAGWGRNTPKESWML